MRSTVRGNPNQFVVSFGVGSGGGQVVSVMPMMTSVNPVKMAA